MPVSAASTSVLTQALEMTPPLLAAPTTSVCAPAPRASAIVMSGSFMSALQPSRFSWPSANSGRQSRMPCATLAASWSGASPRKSR